MAPPTTYKELEELLRERFEEFTPRQRKMAQRILADPEGCAFQTVTQLAFSVGANESTVVRFATSLGLRGYPDLARLCQQRLQEKAQLLERFDALRYLESQEGGVLHRAAAFDQANISHTFAGIDPDSWREAVRTLARARRVRVIGLRKSQAPASLLAYLLGLVRGDVRQLGLDDLLPDSLRRLEQGDALVAISIHRYVRRTVQALRYARSKGVTTVALTDNPASPLAQHADLVFYVEVTGAAILRSVTAFVSLVQALASEVSVELGADTREALALEEELLDEFDVYAAPEEPPAADPAAGTPTRARAVRGAPREP
ncbi:MAG: MurR/RpiR family transcriptional regulator [Micromonosporaceae bacterium]